MYNNRKQKKMDKKQHLQALISGSLFLKPETKDTLFKKLDSLTEAQIDALIDILKDAEEKQIFLIQKILEKNPNFLTDIEHMAIEEISKARKQAEEESNKAEEEEMKKLEEEMDSL